MTYQERRTSIVQDRNEPRAVVGSTLDSRVVDERRIAETRPTGLTVASRIVYLIFGLIQLVIGLRILLLLLDAREANALVAGILNLSQLFVGPFEGVLRTNALAAGGSVLDIAAVVALVGWTIVELVVLAVLRINRSGDSV